MRRIDITFIVDLLPSVIEEAQEVVADEGVEPEAEGFESEEADEGVEPEAEDMEAGSEEEGSEEERFENDIAGNASSEEEGIEEPVIEFDLEGAHRTIRIDTSALNKPKIILSEAILDRLIESLAQMQAVKIQFGVNAEFIKDGEIKTARISNRAVPYSDTFLENGVNDLNEKMAIRAELGSSWKLSRILEVFLTLIKITTVSRLSGRSYIPTPEAFKGKKAIINVQNNDNLCFLYSILAKLKENVVPGHRHRVQHYLPYLKDLKYDEKDMPMKFCNIPKFERANPGLAINVLSYFEDDINFDKNDDVAFKHPFLSIIHRTKVEGVDPIYLLLLEDKTTFHYVYVSNLQKLMNCHKNDVCVERIQSIWCKNCLNGFRLQTAFDKHQILCKNNQLGTTMYLMPTETQLEFTDWSKTINPPFVIYADFESVLVPDEVHHQKHLPIAAGMLLLNNFTGNRTYYQFIGPDCIYDFLVQVKEILTGIVIPYFANEGRTKMLPLSWLENQEYRAATICYLCQKNINKKVKDHDHFSGKYLGPACNKCNLARRLKTVLHIVFHNLRGYDLHHILKHGLSKFPKWSLSCIPNSTEKFLSLIVWTEKATVRFIDSLQFLNASLANAVKTLTELPITNSEFQGSIMDTKGIFPYDFATSLSVLQNTTELPPIWANVTEAEYDKAQQIWQEYGCRTLLDYMCIYLKLDVTLLADVFQQFRAKSVDNNRLDPINFFGVPGMGWASALMTLNEPISLLSDNDMYNFFEAGIRGGLTFVNKHFVKADQNTELLYIDINNLYGWALSQKLPYKDFEWVFDHRQLESILRQCYETDIDSLDYGYELEVDLEIPDEVHDYLDQLPVAAESKCPPGNKTKKLLLTHEPKYNYVIHWRLLQMFIKLGAVVTKITRAVKFSQATIFKSYVDKNTNLRRNSTNKMDKAFYKLMNNSLYGKTVENLKKRINLRLCNNKKKLMTYASKPTFRRTIKIADDLIGLLLNKDIVTLDRPSYIGQVVLDLSKLRMYQLHYIELEKYRKEFNCKLNIIAGDTDSFFLECKNIKLSTLLPAMIRDELLDTSEYNKNHPLYSEKLKAVVGKFKDESEAKFTFKEWVFLRPKCYSLLTDSNEIKKAKGVNLKGTDLTHATYKAVYKKGLQKRVLQYRIGTSNHQLYTFRVNKLALTCNDDKRAWISRNESLAYGHYRLHDSCD